MSRNSFSLNLHVHTVLSPCAGLEMTPGNIINQAVEQGLDIIALTDHNSAENIAPALEIAKNFPLTVIPGMEVETREEVHILCLFPKLKPVEKLQALIYSKLPDRKNRPDFFGHQVCTNCHDKYIKEEDRLLATAADISLNSLVEKVYHWGGVAIPSHVLRTNGLLRQLGFVPPELELPVLEIAHQSELKEVREQYPEKILIKNGDSHRLRELEAGFELDLTEPNLDEIWSILTQKTGEEFLFI